MGEGGFAWEGRKEGSSKGCSAHFEKWGWGVRRMVASWKIFLSFYSFSFSLIFFLEKACPNILCVRLKAFSTKKVEFFFAKDVKKKTREKNVFLLLDNGTNRRRQLKTKTRFSTFLLNFSTLLFSSFWLLIAIGRPLFKHFRYLKKLFFLFCGPLF